MKTYGLVSNLPSTGRLAFSLLLALGLVFGGGPPAGAPAGRAADSASAQIAGQSNDTGQNVPGQAVAAVPSAADAAADDLAALRATLTSPGSPLGPLWTDSLAYNTRCEDEYRQNPDGSWSVRTVCYCDDECCGELGRGEIVSTGEWRPAAAETTGCCSLLSGGTRGALASPGDSATAGVSGALRMPAHTYMARGEFAYSATDLVIPGRGFDYRLVRTYKSQLEGDSPLGHNWDHSYNRWIVVYKTDSDGTIASYLLSDGFGRGLLFSRTSEGVYLSPPRFYMRLTRNPDGSLTVRDRDGAQASFRGLDGSPAAGKITALTDRNGNTMRFLYDSAGRLATVVDTLGRRIEYAYGPTGRLMEVSDFASRRMLFGYDAAGDLIAVTVVAKGQDPATAGRTTRYTYSAGHADGRANHNLLTITPPGFTAPALVNIYGTDPAAFSFDRLIRQEYSGGAAPSCCGGGTTGTLTIAYEPLAHTPGHEGEPALKVTVIDDQGTVTEYYYDDTDYLLRRVAHSPATVAGPPVAPLETAYTWNELDEVAVIVHPLGDRTEYRYDTWNLNPLAQGNLMQERQVPAPGLGGAAITTNFTYEPAFNEIASVTDPAGHVTAYAYDARGNRIRETDALGNSTQRTYDAAGVEQSVTDPNGHTTATDDYHLAPPYADFKTITVPGQAPFDLTFDASLSWDSEDAPTALRVRWDWEDDGVYDTDYRAVLTQTHSFPARGLYPVRLEVIDSDQLTSTVAYKVQVPPRWLYLPIMLKVGRGGLVTVGGQAMPLPTPFGQIKPAASAAITYTLTVTKTDPLGGATVSVYDAYGNPLSITDPRGNTTRYEYDAFDRLVRITDPLAGTTTYTYDAIGNRTSRTDPNGHTWTYEYDGSRLVREVDPLGHATTYTYDARGNRTSVTDANGHTTTYSYDAFNRLVVVTDALGGVTRYSYDANGNRISVTDANGHTTGYTYDGIGRLIRITDPTGGVTGFGYDAVGNTTVITDANGHATRFAYDALRRLVGITDPVGNVTAYRYDAAGNRIAETNAAGRTTTYTYDAANRLTAITNPLGQTTTYVYDAAGNVVAQADPLGQATTFTYDPLNRPIAVTDPLSGTTVYAYDATGNLTALTDPNGHTTAYAYDAANRLVQTTDPLAGRTRFGYDAVGNRTSITDPNSHAMTMAYDPLNRLARLTDPLGNETRFAYDAVGNLIAKTTPNGHTIHYEYDAANRPTQVSYPDGSSVTKAYDAAGNLTAVRGPHGDLTLTYDLRNLLIGINDNLLGKAIGYSYDGARLLATMTDPEGGVTAYGYDAAGRVTDITRGPLSTTYTYDAAGRVASQTLPNGATVSYTYDAAGRLTQVINRRGDGSVVSGFAYTLDAMGNRTGMTLANGDAVSYTYDALNRLVGEIRTGNAAYTRTFSYDPAGNRTQLIADGQVITYTYDAADRLLREAGATVVDYAYDANGNLTGKTVSGQTITYSYDYEDRLTTVAGPGTNVSYQYDPFGRRIGRTEDDVTTRYLYNGAGIQSNVLAEYDGQGTLRTFYLAGLGLDTSPGLIHDGDAYAYLRDGLGSVRQLLDNAGVVQNTYDYDAFGNRLLAVEAIPNAYTFTGRPWDAATGLYDQRTRFMDPRIGRFTQPDKLFAAILLSGGGRQDASLLRLLPLYVYAGNNPVIGVDPLGTDWSISIGIPLVGSISVEFTCKREKPPRECCETCQASVSGGQSIGLTVGGSISCTECRNQARTCQGCFSIGAQIEIEFAGIGAAGCSLSLNTCASGSGVSYNLSFQCCARIVLIKVCWDATSPDIPLYNF